MYSIYFIIFCAIMTHPNQSTIIDLRHDEHIHRFLLKSMHAAIFDKAFNFSPAFFENAINVSIKS